MIQSNSLALTLISTISKEKESSLILRAVSFSNLILYWGKDDLNKGGTIKFPPKAQGHGESSTRDGPSLQEYEALKPSSITAAPSITEEDEDSSSSISCQFPTTALISRSKWDLCVGSPELSKAAIGISRGASVIRDLYEAGTARERAYISCIMFDKIGSASIEELDKEVFIDIDVQEDT